jgi:hypothetical protein
LLLLSALLATTVQAEYLFMKTEKLRLVANKLVHTLNEAPLTNNVQVAPPRWALYNMLFLTTVGPVLPADLQVRGADAAAFAV